MTVPAPEQGDATTVGSGATHLGAPGQLAVRFVRALRSGGLDLGPADSEVFVRALRAVDPADPSQVYWVGRATLVRRPEQVPLYDAVFVWWWGRQGGSDAQDPDEGDAGAPGGPQGPPGRAWEHAPDGGSDGGQAPASAGVLAATASRHEVLRHRDFARCDEHERRQIDRLIARLPVVAPRRRARRSRPSRRESGPLDLGRTANGSLATLGEPLVPWRRRRRQRPRRVVLLLDVSGSMAAYAPALLRFAHAWVRAEATTEVFAMGTRLTRLTGALSRRDPDRALVAASDLASDWSGGTRLGESLDRFCRDWGAPGMAHGAICVVVSDGWERGDPAVLAAATARLRSLAHRLVWVNPHKASPEFEPLARGMAAALPHVDEFVSGHSLAALEDLAAVVAR